MFVDVYDVHVACAIPLLYSKKFPQKKTYFENKFLGH